MEGLEVKRTKIYTKCVEESLEPKDTQKKKSLRLVKC